MIDETSEKEDTTIDEKRDSNDTEGIGGEEARVLEGRSYLSFNIEIMILEETDSSLKPLM